MGSRIPRGELADRAFRVGAWCGGALGLALSAICTVAVIFDLYRGSDGGEVTGPSAYLAYVGYKVALIIGLPICIGTTAFAALIGGASAVVIARLVYFWSDPSSAAE